MKSVNKVILLGSVGHDPEVKITASGLTVGRFSLATSERFKDKNGKLQDRTEWHHVVVWQRLAKIVGEFVSKGSKFYVEGKLQNSSWDDRQNGDKKFRTEIVANDLVLLSTREKGNEAQPPRSDKIEKSKSTDPAVTRVAEISDDDLPF